VLVLGATSVGLLSNDGLLLLSVGISPGNAVLGLPDCADSVDKFDG
jgi:hypothetical protein